MTRNQGAERGVMNDQRRNSEQESVTVELTASPKETGMAQSDYQQMQTHTDMLGVRDAVTNLDKRVSVLEVRQRGADEHLREMREDLKQIGNEVKAIGRELSERISGVGRQLHGHTEREDKDRIELMRSQRNVIITALLTLAAVSAPYVVEFLRTHPSPG